MNGVESDLQGLIDTIWQAVAMRPDKVTGKRVRVPSVVPLDGGQSESRFGTRFPVLRYLDQAVALAGESQLSHLARRFSKLEPMLRWSQNPAYDETNCDPSFLEGYAYAALSGPEGPVYCAAPRVGLMLMGPGVTYPDHRHSPTEVYMVLTPGAQWRLDEGGWFDVAPGDLIYHSAWQMHAMRTSDQPFLAFAGWIEPGQRLEIEFGASR